MELVTLYKRVVGLDVHQAKITACAISEDEAGKVTVELAEFGGIMEQPPHPSAGFGDAAAPVLSGELIL